MYYIDPHIHMVSRVTDDYETLAKMGCVADERAGFLGGFDRSSVDGFRDYFRQLTDFEPRRAGWYGISISLGSASTPKRPRTSAWPAR